MKKKPTLAQWRQAFSLADRIQALAPWKTLADCDTFGLRHGKQTRFCCVMGEGGDHYAVMVYHSAWDLAKINAIASPYGEPFDLLGVACAQVSFETSEYLHDHDLALLKRIDYTPSKEGQMIPRFSARTDWHQDSLPFASELAAIVDAMEFVLAEASGMSRDWLSAAGEKRYDSEWYVYSRDKKAPTGWCGQLERVPPAMCHLPIPTFDVGRMNTLPQRGMVEVDLNGLPTAIEGGQDGRPMVPVILTAVDAESGVVISHEVATADKAPIAPWLEAPELVLKAVSATQTRPKKILYRHDLMAMALKLVCDQLEITLEQRPSLARTTDMLATMNDTM